MSMAVSLAIIKINTNGRCNWTLQDTRFPTPITQTRRPPGKLCQASSCEFALNRAFCKDLVALK